MSQERFDKNAKKVKETLTKTEGKVPSGDTKGSGLLSASDIKSNILLDMKSAVRQVDALRKGDQSDRAVDLSIEQFIKSKYGFGNLDSFYQTLGINPSFHTMENLASMPDFEEGYRWLRPEIVREAVRLGLRRNPIYPDLIASEETVTQKKVTMPSVNMSDAIPEIIHETETIPVGSVSFGEKDVKLQKMGTGLKISDEVQEYVSLNILSLYLQDAGVKLGLGLDTMAVDVLLNGDGSPNSGAPVVGVASSTTGIAYRDMLKLWIRMGLLGRTPTALISNEAVALDVLTMDEFSKWSPNLGNSKQNLNLRTPIPQNQDYLIHGAMPAVAKLGFIDKTSAMIKLNASALTTESERIAERQMNGTYVTITTGFAKLFRDAFIVMNGGAETAYPSYLDVFNAQNVKID